MTGRERPTPRRRSRPARPTAPGGAQGRRVKRIRGRFVPIWFMEGHELYTNSGRALWPNARRDGVPLRRSAAAKLPRTCRRAPTGSSSASWARRRVIPRPRRLARGVGRGIAERGGVLLCGGRSGVMEAAAAGAHEAAGLTIGILPGSNARESAPNPHIDVALFTGLGEARNWLNVCASDAIIAIGGGFGTLSEIAAGFEGAKAGRSWWAPGASRSRVSFPTFRGRPAPARRWVWRLLR